MFSIFVSSFITPSPFPKEDFKNNRWGRGELPFPVRQVPLRWTVLQCSRVLLRTGAHSLLAGSLPPVVPLVAQHSDWIELTQQQVLEVEDTSDYQCPLLFPSIQINAFHFITRSLHRWF